MRDIANFWVASHPDPRPKNIKELIDEFLLSLENLGRSSRHIRDMRNRLKGPFSQTFGHRYPESISRLEIVTFLKARPLTRNSPRAASGDGVSSTIGNRAAGRTIINERSTLTNFFNYLLGQEIIKKSPVGGIRRRELPKVDVKEIKFLSLDEAERYLRACERYDRDLVAHEIVQLFSGVRADDEMADFDGGFVLPQTKEVVIPASVAKTEKREVINGLEPVFWVWWKVYGREGILRPKNYGPRWDRVRVLASISDQAVADELGALPIKTLLKRPGSREALRKWPWNGRRRTFSTYHVAKHQGAGLTALILRHRGSAATLHNSYRGLGVTQKMGEQFFSLRPRPVERPITPVYVPRGIIRLQREAAKGVLPGAGKGDE